MRKTNSVDAYKAHAPDNSIDNHSNVISFEVFVPEHGRHHRGHYLGDIESLTQVEEPAYMEGTLSMVKEGRQSTVSPSMILKEAS